MNEDVFTRNRASTLPDLRRLFDHNAGFSPCQLSGLVSAWRQKNGRISIERLESNLLKIEVFTWNNLASVISNALVSMKCRLSPWRRERSELLL